MFKTTAAPCYYSVLLQGDSGGNYGHGYKEATLADSERISQLVDGLAKKYIAHEFSPAGVECLLSSMRPGEIKKYIESGFMYHIAEFNGQLVGVVGVRDNSHLYHLFVDERYQRQGIAKALWRVAIESCLLKGNPGVFTVNSSRYALPIYERLGFIVHSGPQQSNGVIYIPMKLTISG
jgi:GNAT superfamily N-acetyltransferase